MTDGFAPFIPTLIDDVADRLRALLGADGPVALGPVSPRRDEGWIATLEHVVDGEPVRVDLFPRDCARDAWFRTARLAVAYQSGARDPFASEAAARWLNDLRARIERNDPELAPSPALRALLDAVARWRPYMGLADKDLRLAFDAPGGLTGALWLGFQCDQDCVFCWQRRDVPDPPEEVFAAWLDAMLARGAKTVILSGGEPTARPWLPSLVSRAAGGGARVVLETSGPRLLDATLRRALREAGLRDLSVALHATDATIADAITRAPGAHARAMDAVALCLAEGFTVRLLCVVDALNVAHLPAYGREVAARFGPMGLREVIFMAPTRGADEARYLREMVDLDAVRPRLAEAAEALRAAGIAVKADGPAGFPLCALPPALRVSPPPRAAVAADRRIPPRCDGCAEAARCEGVHAAYLERLGDKGIRPIPLKG